MTLPPGSTTPNAIQIFQWITNPLGYLERQNKDYGDIFTVKLTTAFNNAVFFSRPETMQQVLTSDTKQFSAPGTANRLLKPMLGDRGVILLEGLEHRQRRQLLMPQFHGDKMKAYTGLIQEITDRVIRQWQSEKIINARAQMQQISLGVILQAVFGLDRGDRYDCIRDRLINLLSVVDSPNKSSFIFIPSFQKDLGAWSPWGYFLRQREQLDKLLYQEIADRRKNHDPDRSDVLSLLISAKDEEGQGMSDAELHDELMTLLFAGHETTATALAWALYWIHSIPQVKDKLLAEIASLGTDRDAITISRLPYLNAVCNETLRIYPVAMVTFPRLVEETGSLQGYDLPPGTVVAGCIYLTHRRPDLYPEPHLFKPERFLERQFSPYEFIPFGGGSRRCIGMALAQLEMKLVLVEVLSSCQLELAETKPVKAARRGITLAPLGGVNMKVINA